MRGLRIVSILGIFLSLIAHLISWTTPNLADFAIIGVPLHCVAMVVAWKLFKQRAFPLQNKSEVRWFHHASSGIHALLFLSVLSFMFHTVVLLMSISAFEFYAIRALSSGWLFVFTVGRGFTTWAGQYQINRTRLHSSRFHQKARTAKSELQIQSPPPTLRQR